MSNLFVWIITLLFPGITFLMLGRVFFMVVAFILQATIIGWIPAIIWARITWNHDMEEEEETKKKKIHHPAKKSPHHSLEHPKKTRNQ